MSTVITDNLTGKTSAGDVTITSEGGSATMQLQQGLAKVWINFDGTGTIASRDSLNTSGLVDIGTGQYSFTLANAMSNSSYAAQVTPREAGYMGGFYHSGSTASLVRVSSVTDSGSFGDSNVMACSTLGDLA